MLTVCYKSGLGSSVGIATGYGLDGPGIEFTQSRMAGAITADWLQRWPPRVVGEPARFTPGTIFLGIHTAECSRPCIHPAAR
jgi:hypothetical protein